MRRSNRRLIVTVLLTTAVVAGGWSVFHHQFQTYHLATVQERVLYRDGNRGMDEFSTAVRKVRPRTVVMLVSDREVEAPDKPQFKQEMDYLRDQGVRLVRLPMPPGVGPSTDDVRAFLNLVEDPKSQPVLVHCAQGIVRTGMMVAAYQESVLKWEDERAKACILPFGRVDLAIRQVKDFVDRYDGATRTVTRGPDASLKRAQNEE